jgi:predicted membrane channel-forming protein YqfA (hemolysin III family)
MKNSKLFSLALPDWFKGIVVAVLASILPIILSTIQAGSLTFDWATIGKTAAAALIAYLLKNFFTNSQGQLLTVEPEIKKVA